MDRKKISIGLSVIGGLLNIPIGYTSLFRIGLMFGTIHFSSFTNFIGIIFIASGILAIICALIEFKSLIIGGLLCLITGILTMVLPMINYFYYILTYFYIILVPTIFITVGGILGIWEYKRMK